MGIYLGTNGRNVKRAIKAVLKQIERVSNEPLADYDLDKTKEQLKGNLMLGLENTSNRMSRLAKHELLVGRYISLDETISSIDSVKADEVVEIARELFQKTKYSAVVLGPVADGVLSVFD
jgi:predicted Zn-dependent peptidase